jgi:hypothetical protein
MRPHQTTATYRKSQAIFFVFEQITPCFCIFYFASSFLWKSLKYRVQRNCRRWKRQISMT